MGTANTTCFTTYSISPVTNKRDTTAPVSVLCPFNNTEWYFHHIATMNLTKTMLGLDPFTNHISLRKTAAEEGMAMATPMVVVTYINNAKLGEQLKLYAHLAFGSEVSHSSSISSFWQGINIFLFTTYEPYYVIATSSSSTQALLEGPTLYHASNIPDKGISSALSKIIANPLAAVYKETDFFVASAPVEENLYIGVTLPHDYVYRYELMSLRSVILATSVMVFILGMFRYSPSTTPNTACATITILTIPIIFTTLAINV